jgi:hypothetical protein
MHVHSLLNYLLVDPEDLAPAKLQEAEQSIIRYERCNEVLKEKLSTKTNLVKEGAVCGYNKEGKDSCQVSSWAPCCSALQLSP